MMSSYSNKFSDNIDIPVTICSCCVTLSIIRVLDSKGGVSVGSVSERLSEWHYRRMARGKVISRHDCFLPDMDSTAAAIWIDVPTSMKVCVQHVLLFIVLTYILINDE
jgi:hypothetical protein